MADRVAVMRQGRIEQIAPPRELYEQPRTREIAAFVGHANLWPGTASTPTTVDMPLGRLVTMPHSLAQGARVSILVRPEKVRLGKSEDGVNTFTGELTRDRFLGSVRRFDLAVPGGVITGETSATGPITNVHIPPVHVRLLPETGQA